MLHSSSLSFWRAEKISLVHLARFIMSLQGIVISTWSPRDVENFIRTLSPRCLARSSRSFFKVHSRYTRRRLRYASTFLTEYQERYNGELYGYETNDAWITRTVSRLNEPLSAVDAEYSTVTLGISFNWRASRTKLITRVTVFQMRLKGKKMRKRWKTRKRRKKKKGRKKRAGPHNFAKEK